MQISKKLLLSVLCFLLTLILCSLIILYPVTHHELRNYMDANLRSSLVGRIDRLFLGASQGVTSYQPYAVDPELDCFSYNLSAQMMDWDSRIYMLKKELARNPVKHVTIEVSYDALCRDESSEFAEGSAITVQRLDSFWEVMDFMATCVSVNDWLNIYSRLLASGLSQWTDLLFGHTDKQIKYANRGYYDLQPKEVTLDDVSNSYIPTNYLQEDVEKLEQMLQLCRDAQVEYCIIVVPLSDAMLYAHEGWDDFYKYLNRFCQEQGCELYDFNLLHDRYTLFSDKTSFSGTSHMSIQGAAAFSQAYVDIMKKVENGEQVDSLFYSSYQEMLQDSPYAN